jgi:hypothetical protein
MAQRQVFDNLVVVLAAVALLGNVTGLFKVVDDALHSSFCDTDSKGNVAHARVGFPSQAVEHMGVVGEKGPVTQGNLPTRKIRISFRES